MKLKKLIPLLCILTMLSGCTPNTAKTPKQVALYNTETVSIYNSPLIDTYLIACALYFDFESPNFPLPSSEIGKDIKTYFSKYKDHKFIKSLKHHVDISNQSFSFNTLVPLTYYCYWNEKEGIPEAYIRSNTFSSMDDFNDFLNELETFNRETHANDFLKKQAESVLSLQKRIQEEFKTKDLDQYIDTMEKYVHTKELYYPNQTIRYSILTTRYRSEGASFINFNQGESQDFICFTSLPKLTKKTLEKDIDRIIENAIHEYLHLFINQGVQKQSDLINKLAKNQHPSDYVGSLYERMPWPRIVDENIVRAVETRIYAQVLKNDALAYEQILNKEIQWGGFQKVDQLYTTLHDYETAEKSYPTFEDFIPKLIYTLFK